MDQQRTPTYFYASGSESVACPHVAPSRRDESRIECMNCGASAYAPTGAGAASFAEAVKVIAEWQGDDVFEDDVEDEDDVVVSLADEVAEAETLMHAGIVDAEGTASLPVSGTLHGQVLLILAGRDDVRAAGLTLVEGAAWARACAVVIERVRIGTAFFAETAA